MRTTRKAWKKIDQELCNKINFYEDVDKLVDTAFSCITAACNAAFKVSRGAKHLIKNPVKLAIIHEVENGTMYTNEVYIDGSKIEYNIGAAGIIFVNGKLIQRLKFKLHGCCSNNQAEQIAILKVLERLEALQDGQDDKHVAIYTDSKITVDLLQNKFKQPIDGIYQKIIALVHLKWTMHFSWVKGHTAIEGNELVDRLAKKLLRKTDHLYTTRCRER